MFILFIAGVLDDDEQHLKARNLIDAGDGRCDDDGAAGRDRAEAVRDRDRGTRVGQFQQRLLDVRLGA